MLSFEILGLIAAPLEELFEGLLLVLTTALLDELIEVLVSAPESLSDDIRSIFSFFVLTDLYSFFQVV